MWKPDTKGGVQASFFSIRYSLVVLSILEHKRNPALDLIGITQKARPRYQRLGWGWDCQGKGEGHHKCPSPYLGKKEFQKTIQDYMHLKRNG
jgi:hypothetical protein